MLPGKRTNDGAIYIAQGPPPAGTPLVGGIAVSHTGVIYVSQAFVQSFSPADLFKLGEQGAWYDPSDLTTMFQDRAGTTPVTADGQPVGLILDKSKGLVLGPELVTNGDFATDTGWTKSAGTTISGGKVNLASVAINTIAFEQTGYSLVVGKTYEIKFEISNYSSGSFSIRLGNNTLNNITGINANGSYVYRIVQGNTGTQSFSVFVAVIGTASFDNISVKEIPGNHAVAPSDAARPLYKTDGTYHWLQFDGVDDSLATSAIAFSGKYVNSCMGVYVANTSLGIIYETSDTANFNLGAFNSYCNDAGTGGIVARANSGTGFSGPVEVAVPAPNTSVYSIDYNFTRTTSGQGIYIRRNGAAYSNGGYWASGGDFTTQPLYIGRRGGASLAFTGRIYSLVIRCALSTTQEITNTETWVNGKTGAF